ncbi:MAG TPA: COP23 domain-containing protein [Allocoleopsis sp.]
MNIKTLSEPHIGLTIAKLSSSIFTLLSVTILTQPSFAESTTFFCGTSNGIPATIARTPRGEVLMILWNSSNFGELGDTPQKRCEEVSHTFQTYYNMGKLKYITTDRRNGQVVACVAQEENGPCGDEALFTLKSDETTPRASLQRIFRIRVASAAPINETGSRLYISLDKYLNGEYPSLSPSGEPTPSPLPGSSRQ